MSDGNIRIIEMPAADAVEDNDFLAIDNNSVAQSNDDTTAGTRKVRAKDFVQASLTVDETPTEDSENLVTSGGVYDAVDGLNDKITSMEIIGTASGEIATFDDGSANPIKELTAQIVAVQSGSGEPSPENVRPISGWDGANVEVVGANLWDEVTEKGYLDGTGNPVAFNDSIRAKNYIEVKPNTTYYFKFSGSDNCRIFSYDSNKTYISGSSTYVKNSTYTTPANAKYVKFYMPSSYGTTYNNDISFNYPSTDTSYHAYNGNTYPISWQTECGTVYGGNFKLFKDGGKWYCTVTAEKSLLTDSDMRSGVTVSSSTDSVVVYQMTISDAKNDSWIIANRFSTQIPTGNAGRMVKGGRILYWVIAKSELSSYDASGCYDWFDTHPSQFLYNLATPETYTFEIDTEIATLLGNNNIFADCGDVDVTYQRDLNIVINKLLQG